MKTVNLPQAVSELGGDGVTAFEDEGDDAITTLITTPNQWGSENRDGYLALVMIEGDSVCGFKLHVNEVENLITAIRKAAANSH